ncbi:MAG: hypothetical protein GY708_13600 [Actinomycetia bacterium]|nr:hypothetical protein [Actinomycetes bacterium]
MGLGHPIASSTVWQILKASGIDLAPPAQRSDVTWSQLLHSQPVVACDFFTVDTAFLRRYYVPFFIHVEIGQVLFAGANRQPHRRLNHPSSPQPVPPPYPNTSTVPALSSATAAANSLAPPATTTVLRTTGCDGLVNEYRNAG